MPLNNSLAYAIGIIKQQQHKTKTLFKYPKKVNLALEFYYVLWRAGFICSVSFKKRKLWRGIKNSLRLELLKRHFGIIPSYLYEVILQKKFYGSEPSFVVFHSKYAKSRFLFISYRTLLALKFRTLQNTYVLSTSFGLVTSDEIHRFNLRTGGLVLCVLR